MQTPPSSQGPFRLGASYGTAHSDFDQGFDAVNPASEAGGGGSYTAQAGDTLAGLAQALWGDASLWYLLAEANGLAGLGAATPLAAGQSLIVPRGANLHNDAGTMRPYDAASALGDVQPGTGLVMPQ